MTQSGPSDQHVVMQESQIRQYFLKASHTLKTKKKMSIHHQYQICPTCKRAHDRPVRRCEKCGLELVSKEDFYPALWSYGCPRYDKCRERLTFSDDQLHCHLHGGTYRIGEEELDEPIRLSTSLIIYTGGEHLLEHIEGDVDKNIDHYTIMSCPICDPSGYFVTDGPVGDPCFSLYMLEDEEGRAVSFACRACGLTDHEYLQITAPQGSRDLASQRHNYPSPSEEGIGSIRGSDSDSPLNSVIDNAFNRIAKLGSSIEDLLRSPVDRESTVPRFLELIVGVLCLPLAAIFAFLAFSFAAEIMAGGARDRPAIVAVSLITALCVFFAMASYRLLLARPRGPYGGLLSPTFMIAFGIFMCSIGTWMLLHGEGDFFALLFGLASVSTGLSFRRRARAATCDESGRQSDED